MSDLIKSACGVLETIVERKHNYLDAMEIIGVFEEGTFDMKLQPLDPFVEQKVLSLLDKILGGEDLASDWLYDCFRYSDGGIRKTIGKKNVMIRSIDDIEKVAIRISKGYYK